MKIEINETGLLNLGKISVQNGTQSQWTDIALEWLEQHIAHISSRCDHQIADAKNDVVVSGYFCVKCGKLFAGVEDHTPSAKDAG